jgi:hypothetical protein
MAIFLPPGHFLASDLGEVLGDRAALHHDLLAAEVVPGLDALVVALLGVDRDTGGEVVDEVDALADLLAGVGVDALLAVLGVGHRRHGDVVPLGAQTRDQGVERAVLELELHAELLAHRVGEVGVDADGLAGFVLELDRRVRDVRADLDDALVADGAGSWSASGAALESAVSELPLSLSLVWSPQPVSSRAPATAIAPTAAIRDCAGVVRRVERAVMVGSSGGWVELPMGRQ